MSVDVRRMPMVDVFVPRPRGLLRDTLLVVGFGTLLAVFGRIAIPLPFTPVPITGQTLGVVLIGALLGSRRGSLAMLVHISQGFAGLPVFAGGLSAWNTVPAGVPWAIGPSAGYVYAFPLAACVVGFLAERGWDRRFVGAISAMAVGHLLIYAIGAAWLSWYVGPDRALALGVLPFLVGDAVKTLVAAAALPSGWRLIGSGSQRGL